MALEKAQNLFRLAVPTFAMHFQYNNYGKLYINKECQYQNKRGQIKIVDVLLKWYYRIHW
jgi:hypothetical protein